MYYIYLLSPTSEILNYSPRMQMLTIKFYIFIYLFVNPRSTRSLDQRTDPLYSHRAP